MKNTAFSKPSFFYALLMLAVIPLCSCATTQEEAASAEFKLAQAEAIANEPITKLAFTPEKPGQTIKADDIKPIPENIETAAGEEAQTVIN